MTSNTGAAARILILGLGDLGVRIAQSVVEQRLSSVCMLAGQSGAAKQWAQLLTISTGRDVRSTQLDGQDEHALALLLSSFEPDLIVQCATLLSPFAIAAKGTPVSEAVRAGGFALQVAAQLPVIRAVMKVRRRLAMNCPVVNCSYPDVTNPVLATEGLAPSAGIGNVAIMAMRFAALLPEGKKNNLQVIGQHAQLGPSLAGRRASQETPVPLVYADGRLLPEQELLLDTGLQPGSTLNHLAAATALPIIRAFVEREGVHDTHAPGILGLPGGYPVRIAGGEVELRLPQGVAREDAVAFNRLAAKGEGLESIGEDGTIVYTEAARKAVAEWCPELAEPLRVQDVARRLEVLQDVLRA
ncbi:MAG TPA: hypothetical protein VGN16_16335 [Acidobacteriaceae bacterium]|jgi:hypothetical protein